MAMAKRVSTAVVTAISGAAIIGVASPALAEGSWTSSLSNAKGGFESRRWTDHQNDGNHTKIKVVNPETEGNRPKEIGLALRGDRGALPDRNFGTKWFAGGRTTTQDWGKPNHTGQFHFTVATITGFNLGWWVDSLAVYY